jgi:hypothetical protein
VDAAEDVVKQLIVVGRLFETKQRLLELVQDVVGLGNERVNELAAIIVSD